MYKTILTVFALSVIASAGYFYLNTEFSPIQEDAIISSFSTSTLNHWQAFKKAHMKTYASAAEETYRLGIFHSNLQMIESHNADSTQTYTMAVNQFADLTSEQFAALYRNLDISKKSNHHVHHFNVTDLPASVDWVAGGAVTPVKDQGQCGSCWAFSAVGAMEGAYFVEFQQLLSLSESVLVDCSGKYKNQGCNGGLMDQAFDYVKDHGIPTEETYPYHAVHKKCAYKATTAATWVVDYKDVPKDDVEQLAAAVAQQPVSIAVDANKFQFYSGGVFKDCGKKLDHGVTLVGYTADAWVVKNSWGEGWGEKGYIRLARGNTCGLASAASFPTMKHRC